MENKYYTPSIEEFHVGFEFEFLNPNNKWTKQIVRRPNYIVWSDVYLWELLGLSSTNHLLRVKYLDKEDIESLGFRYSGNLQDTYWKGEITISPQKDGKLLIHQNCGPLFHGYIKNLSELKRLFKQIGIDGE
jgi:hypothetical protein